MPKEFNRVVDASRHTEHSFIADISAISLFRPEKILVAGSTLMKEAGEMGVTIEDLNNWAQCPTIEDVKALADEMSGLIKGKKVGASDSFAEGTYSGGWMPPHKTIIY